MIEPAAGKTKARRDVFRFEIRQLFEDLFAVSRGDRVPGRQSPESASHECRAALRTVQDSP